MASTGTHRDHAFDDEIAALSAEQDAKERVEAPHLQPSGRASFANANESDYVKLGWAIRVPPDEYVGAL